MTSLEQRLELERLEHFLGLEPEKPKKGIGNYLKGVFDPDNSRLYGTFQQRLALNVTQFPKIQGSMLIRMGAVYPIMSYIVQELGLPPDAALELAQIPIGSEDSLPVTINFHTWTAGYLAYLTEIQGGLSKHTVENAGKLVGYVKNKLKRNPAKA